MLRKTSAIHIKFHHIFFISLFTQCRFHFILFLLFLMFFGSGNFQVYRECEQEILLFFIQKGIFALLSVRVRESITSQENGISSSISIQRKMKKLEICKSNQSIKLTNCFATFLKEITIKQMPQERFMFPIAPREPRSSRKNGLGCCEHLKKNSALRERKHGKILYLFVVFSFNGFTKARKFSRDENFFN